MSSAAQMRANQAQQMAAMSAANAGLQAARMEAQALNNGFANMHSVWGNTQYDYKWVRGDPGNF